jgi:hypothetical protein
LPTSPIFATLDQLRFARIARRHAPPSNQLAQVGDIVEPAFIRPVLAVTAVAVRLENGVRLLRQVARLRLCAENGARRYRMGQKRNRQDAQNRSRPPGPAAVDR